MVRRFHRKAADLPAVIPIFPLDAVLLLPHGELPLNIFEPRYMNMIDDALAGERLIGMVQTRAGASPFMGEAPILSGHARAAQCGRPG